MKCDYCREIYKTGTRSITVKMGKNIIKHFCSESCLEMYYYEKIEYKQEELEFGVTE